MLSLVRNARCFLLCAAILLSSLSCRTEVSGQYSYEVPELTADGLQTGHVSSFGMDTVKLFRAIEKINAGKYSEIHSLLIYKNDQLVLEEYFSGHDYDWEKPNFWGPVVQWDRDRLHNIMSDTKSVTSALIGIAIDKGFIKDEQESVFNYLPDYVMYRNQGREEIRIEHLLTMTSGLEGNEWTSSYKNLDNPIIKLWLVEDPIKAILDRPMVAEPGTYFSYWGGNNILLGEILKNATARELDSFAEEYLFGPLSIENYVWPNINEGPQDAAGGLELTPRAMIKIGILFLNKGQWAGKQIVSKDWVNKSATPYKNNTGIKVPGAGSWRQGYTYSWWTKSYTDPTLNLYSASGWGGQTIMILPEKEMVVVFTGGNYSKAPPPRKIMDKYIIPAITD